MTGEERALLEDLITPEASKARVGLRIKFLSDVVAKPQKYLWAPYIPSDQLIGLYGPSHTAKSIIALDWAARITTSAKWPDGSLT
jgi:AAA domain-containing protein